MDQRPKIGAGTPLFPGSEMPWGGPVVPVRIYRPARAVTQSGPGRKDWALEFERTVPPRTESLMGWATAQDPFANLRLYFPNLESAVAFAERHGWPYSIEEPPSRSVAPKSHADRFKYDLRAAMERPASNDMTVSSAREQISFLGANNAAAGRSSPPKARPS